MNKSDFISGTIMEFKLPANFGYGYCKVLDFRSIRAFDGVIVKVFDLLVENPIAEIQLLRDRDWLFGARRMPWLPGSRGKGAWKVKGVLISKEDEIVPEFKYCIKSHPSREKEFDLEPWDVVRDLNIYVPCTYDKVEHLEDTIVSPRIAIEIRTAMEYCRINKLDVAKYFDLTHPLNELIFSQMSNVPVFATIPKQYRGRAKF